MQTTFKPVRHGARGFALILTLVFLTVSLIIFGSIMYWVSSNAKVTLRNNQFNMSENAAEAGVETALAQMDRDFLYGSLTNASFYSTLLPNQTNWIAGYQFSDTNANTNAISVWLGPAATTTTNLNSQFTGLYGFEQDCTITATATPASASGAGSSWVYSVPATVNEALQFAKIPIFQFAIFYNINLEIAPGQPMTITGPVFCNQSIWEGTGDTTYASTVTAVGTNNTTTADPFSNGYTDTGNPTFSLSGQPLSNANALTLPIAGATNSNPTNVESIINLPPATYAMGSTAAYSTNGEIYLANAVDLYITNSAIGTNSLFPTGINRTTGITKTNLLVYYQDPSTTPSLTLVTPDFYVITNATALSTYTTNYINPNLLGSKTNVWFAGYSFVTNVLFYDWREGYNGGSGINGNGKVVQAVQFDITNFMRWQTNTGPNGGNTLDQLCLTHKGGTHHIDSVYIYNAVPLTSTTLPAVRVVHGSQLPTAGGNTALGFTIATPMPIYVLGNYNVQDHTGATSLGTNNTTHTYPAAFLADAVTVLSTGWSDTSAEDAPTAANTTVNAAMLEGIVPTNPNISGNYSGGVENFLRLLEKWSTSTTLTYNGSIVVMFPSQYATNLWSYGNYYEAPARNWAFDANFAANKLPPLTPETKAVIRGQWSAY